jgi:hypothetical protein
MMIETLKYETTRHMSLAMRREKKRKHREKVRRSLHIVPKEDGAA